MLEPWVLFAIAGAVSLGLFNITKKQVMGQDTSALRVDAQMHILAALPMIAVLAISYPFEFSMEFVGFLLASGLVNAVSFWLLATAYENGALSLIAPLRGVTPVAVGLIEPLVFPELGYQLSLVIASVAVGVGLYVLLYEDTWLGPIRKLSEDGVYQGLLSAGFISVAILIDRFAMTATGVEPNTYAAYLTLTITVITVGMFVLFDGTPISKLTEVNLQVASLGFFRFANILLGLTALSLVAGTKVNIVWQLGIVLAALVGGKLLSEENLIRKAVGASMIVAAAAIVVL